MEGLEYSRVTFVSPTICSVLEKGLGAGVSICAEAERKLSKPITEKQTYLKFFMVVEFWFVCVKIFKNYQFCRKH